MTQYRLCTPILVLLVSAVCLQAAALSGTVTNMENGEPVPFANVMLPELEIGTAADVHGFYIFPDLPQHRDIQLTIRMIGFARLDTVIRLTGKSRRLNLSLDPVPIQLPELQVSKVETPLQHRPELNRITFSSPELRLAPAIFESDVFRTVQLLPSVLPQSDYSSAFYVRGGSPDENQIVLDGTQIYNPYHVGGIFSTFNTDALSAVEFLPGGFQADYGSNLSSVMNITTKMGNSENGRLRQDRWLKKYWDWSEFRGNINLLSAKFLAEGPLYKGSWFLSARRTYFDQLAAAYYALTDQQRDWGYYFGDLHLKLNYRPADGHRITYAHFGGVDDLSIDVTDPDYPEVGFAWKWGNRTHSLEWQYSPEPDIRIETVLARTSYYFDVNFDLTVFRESSFTDTTDSTTIQAEMNNRVRDLTLSQKAVWYPVRQHKLQLGYELKYLDTEYLEKYWDAVIIDRMKSPHQFALFIRDTWRPGLRWSFDIGTRLTKYEYHDNIVFDPRFNAHYFINENLVLKASGGIYSQFLFTMNQDDQLLRLVDFWQPVSEYYDPQRAVHWILGTEYQFLPGTVLSCDLYYKPYLNVLDQSKVIHPSNAEQGFVEGKADAMGLELMVKREMGRLTGWIGYAWSSVEREFDYNKNGIIESDLGEVYDAGHDIPHSLNMTMNLHLDQRQDLALTLVWHSGQPFTPPQARTYHQSDNIWGSMDNPYQRFDAVYGRKNSARYPAYFRLDVGYRRSTRIFGVPGRLELQVINLTNHFNTLFYNWDFETSPMQVRAFSMFPVMATVGWEFEL